MDTNLEADSGGASIDLEPDLAIAILRTIHAGWLSTSTVTPAGDEVKITERLRAAMRTVVAERRHPWSRQMVILPSTESLSHPSLARPGGRTDMSILIVGVFEELKDHGADRLANGILLEETLELSLAAFPRRHAF